MALTERKEVDKIEVVGPYKIVQIRTSTIIENDGAEVARSVHRSTLSPSDSDEGQDDTVKAIKTAVHTAAIISAYENR